MIISNFFDMLMKFFLFNFFMFLLLGYPTNCYFVEGMISEASVGADCIIFHLKTSNKI